MAQCPCRALGIRSVLRVWLFTVSRAEVCSVNAYPLPAAHLNPRGGAEALSQPTKCNGPPARYCTPPLHPLYTPGLWQSHNVHRCLVRDLD
eukprot:8928854-Pyramimonas_sp.AAC.1